jgi:hypothetical protein
MNGELQGARHQLVFQRNWQENPLSIVVGFKFGHGLSTRENLSAKHSTKQLFIKDYNWLDVILDGSMKGKNQE